MRIFPKVGIFFLLFLSCAGMNQRVQYEEVKNESLRVIIRIDGSEQIELDDLQYEELIYIKSSDRAGQLLKIYLLENDYVLNETDFNKYCSDNFTKESFIKIKEFENDNSDFVISEFTIKNPEDFFNKDNPEKDNSDKEIQK
ncbi:MAG: hypothetical protein JW982_04015 [Spirochaetes bacterium]|nr:hypothetical protein [Spirochaetota bacterium]